MPWDPLPEIEGVDWPWYVRWRLRERAWSLAVALGALGLMALIWHDYRVRQQAAEHPDQPAVAAYRHARVADAADAEEAQDAGLMADEDIAGAMWARHHGAVSPVDCPDYSPAFRRGCVDYLNDGERPVQH